MSHPGRYKKELTPKTKDSKRSDVGRKPGPYKWYEIQDNVAYYSLFEKEKIIYPNIATGLYPVYDDSKYYTNQKCFILTSDSINLKYLNGLLASNVLNFIFSLIGSNLGSSGYDLNKIFVEQLPIVVDFDNQNNIIRLVNNIIILNKEIEKYENELFNILRNDYNIINFSKKIENFYNLSSKEFLKEIRNKNKNFDENYLLNIFENSKNNIQILKEKVQDNRAKLNTVVYKIYQLNDDEISIIENDC